LRELNFASVRLNRGGIPFRGEWVEGWRACLQSRIAQRIQILLGRFAAPTEDALYQGVHAVDWTQYVTHRQTISVACVCQGSGIRHSGFAALKTKDAIVDRVRSATGQRPSVSRDDADVRVFLYLVNDKAALYLDLSGTPLHRRGYRARTGEAPLRETLAAAMLRSAGWDRTTPLIDPLCGSGTIAIEAALWAAKIAPGLLRARFGFERWANFGDAEAGELRVLCGELRRAATAGSATIVASDSDPAVLEYARENARAAGVKIAFRERPLAELQRDRERAFVVTNPPYGVRLESDESFVREAASRFCRLHGWRVCLLAGSEAYRQAINLKPVRAERVPNGAIDCEFLVYDVP